MNEQPFERQTLKGKVCLVTGGSAGIGRATALAAAREGARVGVLGRSASTCSEVVSEIEGLGGQALCLPADVSSPQDMQSAIALLVETYGGLDCVFSNAGINGIWAPVEDIEPEEWDRTININLKGAFLTVKYAVPHMKQKGGSIVIDSSTIGNRVFSNVGSLAYGCTKAALVSITKTLALELGEYHIRVNAVLPGPIHTNITSTTCVHPNLSKKTILKHVAQGYPPVTDGKGGSPPDVAETVIFLFSEASRFTSGAEIVIDGANSLLKG